jgi:hypothetical protein
MEVTMQTDADWFWNAIQVCYADPESTLQRMQEYRSINGTDALIERLFKRPDLFEVTMWVDTSPSAFRRRSKEVRAALSLLPILTTQRFTIEKPVTEVAVD